MCSLSCHNLNVLWGICSERCVLPLTCYVFTFSNVLLVICYVDMQCKEDKALPKCFLDVQRKFDGVPRNVMDF